MARSVTTRRGWRIGELAEATGLTVRTLHHYEHVGLLPAAARTRGQQRIYDESDVRRLYRIRALRDLGLSLADIRLTLDENDSGFAELLRAHRDRVVAEIERLERLRALLDHACAQAEDELETDEVLATIDAMSRVIRRSDARRDSGDVANDSEVVWRELGEELRACMDAGEQPNKPWPRAIARAAQSRMLEFSGGDSSVLQALEHLRQSAPPSNFAGWTPAMMRYLDDALRELDENEDGTC